jgi:hypothetical protein
MREGVSFFGNGESIHLATWPRPQSLCVSAAGGRVSDLANVAKAESGERKSTTADLQSESGGHTCVSQVQPATAGRHWERGELEFRKAVEDGLASLGRGERIPPEEARRLIPQWS